MYIARQLSFHGVTFDIREVTLGEKFREMFDASVELVSIYTKGRGTWMAKIVFKIHQCIN